MDCFFAPSVLLIYSLKRDGKRVCLEDRGLEMHGPRNTYFFMSIWNMKHRVNEDMSFVMLFLKLSFSGDFDINIKLFFFFFSNGFLILNFHVQSQAEIIHNWHMYGRES